ncbi:ATP-binding protein [Candidatus Uabimicrobium amorphum]|uniref:histidine kinase n=1 Tax=Uabimicrobium amorphum TaxID=2596890 RepID=A0A5S9ISZ0_UABAM|nr:ATP-binding protein [Candidatus Uabimicrobium amorphum]BBM87056.1 two-component sensor histidine kinase [Candidatus Uabimicrobium amorphum]
MITKRKPKSKIGKKLFLLFTVSTLVPLVIMTVQGFHCAHRAVHNAAEAHLLSCVEAKKNQIKNWLEEREREIQFLSEIPCLQSCCCDAGYNESVCNILRNTIERMPSYENICIFDISGNVILQEGKKKYTKNFSLPTEFKAALKSKSSVFSPIFFSDKGIPQIQIAYWIQEPDGQKSQILWVHLNLQESINKFLSEKSWLGKSGNIILINKNGELIVPKKQKTITTSKNILELIKEKKVGTYPSHYKKIGAYNSIDSLDMIVVAEMSWKEAMSELFPFLKFSFITAGISLVFMFFIASMMSKRISTPLLQMSTVARKVAGGDLEQRVSSRYTKNQDEVATLAFDFNSMVEELQENRQRMEQKHRELINAYENLERTKYQLNQIESLAVIGKTAASIVHEIRNPLSSVKMNLQILTRKLQDDPKYHEHGHIALTEVQHLENVLSELLDYSRPIKLEQVVTDIDHIIKESLQSISGNISEKEIEICCNVVPVKISIDKRRFKQVLSNIILNAIQASRPKQRITIEAFYNKEESKTIIEVIDQGEGISSEYIEEVFEPFFTTREKGTGLGLSHVKKIVELHSGTIKIESSRGEGTTVRIALPINKEENTF